MHKEKQKKSKKVERKKVIIKMHEGLLTQHPYAAGIDIGDTEIAVAIRSPQGGYEVSTFGTFSEDLDSIVSHLKDNPACAGRLLWKAQAFIMYHFTLNWNREP